MLQLKSEILARRPLYNPVLSELERRAYQAAHLIASANFEGRILACPGGQRTRKVDTIAGLIIQTFGKKRGNCRSYVKGRQAGDD